MSFKPLYPDKAILLDYKESASLTAVQGNLVYLTGGYLTECGADPAIILGVLAEDGSNGSEGANSAGVWLALPGTIFVAEGTTTTAQTQVGEDYGVALESSVWRVDTGDTGNVRVNVIALDPRDAAGTDEGRYHVTFISSASQASL